MVGLIMGQRSQRSIGTICFFGPTFNVCETSVLDHNKLDVILVNLQTWSALTFYQLYSHNHVELMAIKPQYIQ
jgi:hypothetical protein